MLRITTNLKNTFYVDKEIQDIVKKYYQTKRNLISFLKGTISFSFVWTKTFDRGFVTSDLVYCRIISVGESEQPLVLSAIFYIVHFSSKWKLKFLIFPGTDVTLPIARVPFSNVTLFFDDCVYRIQLLNSKLHWQCCIWPGLIFPAAEIFTRVRFRQK